MISLLLNLFFKSISVFAVAKLLPGIYIRNFTTAVVVAAVYGLINLLLGKILIFLAFPAVFVTFGLFVFVIDAFLLWITDKLVEGFQIAGFGTTLAAAFLISALSGLLNWVF